MGPAARDYAPGQIIPGTKYRVLHRLGGGGMGTVYDVEDISVGKKFVLKALHPQLGDNEDLARRLAKEARVLGRLHHTNIVEVITAGVTEDDLHLPFYVMEKLNGQSVRVILEKKRQIDVGQAVRITIDLLDALEHAHEAGVIHRDVKPDNIFLHRTPANVTVTKLLDFGVVSLLDGGKRETAGRFLGTLRYAAPEQLQGKDPTVKMDVYCAGLVLYEMIAGRGPFDDMGDSWAIARGHMNHKAPPLSQFILGVPREIERLLAAALAKDPDGRPRDAFSFGQSLRNIRQALVAGPADNPMGTPATSPDVLSPASASRTTVRGMSAPPEAAVSQAITTNAAGEEPVDRGAATHSMAQDALSEAPAGETVRLPAAAQVEPIAPIQWPPERPPAPTDEPQVRSIPAVQPRSSTAVAVIAGIAVFGLGIAATALLVLRHAPGAAVPAATPGIVAAPPQPEPVVTMPAPTIAPPSLEDLPAPSASVVATTTASAPKPPAPTPTPTPTQTQTQTPTPAPKPRTTAATPAPRPPPAAAPAEPDRPGPGF